MEAWEKTRGHFCISSAKEEAANTKKIKYDGGGHEDRDRAGKKSEKTIRSLMRRRWGETAGQKRGELKTSIQRTTLTSARKEPPPSEWGAKGGKNDCSETCEKEISIDRTTESG